MADVFCGQLDARSDHRADIVGQHLDTVCGKHLSHPRDQYFAAVIARQHVAIRQARRRWRQCRKGGGGTVLGDQPLGRHFLRLHIPKASKETL